MECSPTARNSLPPDAHIDRFILKILHPLLPHGGEATAGQSRQEPQREVANVIGTNAGYYLLLKGRTNMCIYIEEHFSIKSYVL